MVEGVTESSRPATLVSTALQETLFGVEAAEGLPGGYLTWLHYLSFDCLPNDLSKHCFGASLALIHRHRTCRISLNRMLATEHEGGPDNFDYNESLFQFFTSGISALESLAYAAFALGSRVDPVAFDMSSDKALARIGVESTAQSFAQRFPDYQIGSRLADIDRSTGYRPWKKARNVLLHRAIPPRLISLHLPSGVRHDSWPDLGISLDPDAMIDRLYWLEGVLRDLLVSIHEFGEPEVAAPAEAIIRSGGVIRT